MDPSLGFLLLVLLTLISSFWTALENALASLGRVRVTALLKEHSKHRKLLQELLESPALIISSIAFLLFSPAPALLSGAVDMHTGQALFQDCLVLPSRDPLLADKTALLEINAVQCLEASL